MSGKSVMGIVNVTPDSFSDAGKYFLPSSAVSRALRLEREGADIIDIGAESTRPGAVKLSWQEEFSRLEEVLRTLVLEKAALSVDTYHPETAERAVKLGAKMINCVYPESVPEMLAVQRANRGVQIVVPASFATPENLPRLEDFYIDPMIGFGTTREEDLALLRKIPVLAKSGRVLVGVSKKRIVRKLTGEKRVGKNLGGNIALALWALQNGAACVRVHDVAETVQAWKAFESVQNGVL